MKTKGMDYQNPGMETLPADESAAMALKHLPVQSGICDMIPSPQSQLCRLRHFADEELQRIFAMLQAEYYADRLYAGRNKSNRFLV